VFDPTFVKTISVSDGKALIDKLKNYPCPDNGKILDNLKSSFKFIKEAADTVTASEVDVIRRHFQLK
jgi:hypothetical protein